MSEVLLNRDDCIVVEYRHDTVPQELRDTFARLWEGAALYEVAKESTQQARVQIHQFAENDNQVIVGTCPFLTLFIMICVGESVADIVKFYIDHFFWRWEGYAEEDKEIAIQIFKEKLV